MSENEREREEREKKFFFLATRMSDDLYRVEEESEDAALRKTISLNNLIIHFYNLLEPNII